VKLARDGYVVTHWPLDADPNHHVTSSLVWQCYLHDFVSGCDGTLQEGDRHAKSR
jgi:hypothetical protein